ncbi:MAG TPA: hypothetical protein VEI50_13105 [Nitrospiraceae bacterium]|nr:hypothetical protein [Nitrospiraceae bacterium]
MTDSSTRSFLSTLLFCLSICWVMWAAACASGVDQTQSGADQTQWIRIGMTTKEEVVARYGEPDFVEMRADGAVATYRPTASKQSAPRVEIPTVQPGPFGTATTKMQPVEPGLGAEGVAGGKHARIRKEIRIRYDAQGTVQEVME